MSMYDIDESQRLLKFRKKVLLECFEWVASYRIILKLTHSAEKRKL